MRRRSILLAAIVLSAVSLTLFHTATRADDAAAPAVVAPPLEVIDQMMNLIGQNQVDQATNMMDGLKNQPEMRNVARDKLIHLHDEQGVYHGYDVAATQRFTPQFQTVDVLAYYDQQPVMLRFHFYRPLKDGSWNVLGFQITTSVQEISEILKDTPVDYLGQKTGK